MKIKTSELSGAALDWAVARADIGEDLATDWHPHHWLRGGQRELRATPYSPSTDWSQGGPIIERERIRLDPRENEWKAQDWDFELKDYFGHTPLIAAMRCFVASRLGEEVDVPEELCQ